MARVDPRQAVLLDDYFDVSQAETVVWNGAMAQIFFKAGSNPEMNEKIYSTLKSKAPQQVKIYRKLELPPRFHYGKSARIGDIVLVADEGWTMTSRDRYRAPAPTAEGGVRYRGAHGCGRSSSRTGRRSRRKKWSSHSRTWISTTLWRKFSV
jgi:hypothetical protein